jgi:hypothetical protein
VLAAGLLLAACEPALAPDARVSPAPAPSVPVQALLQAMHKGGGVDHGQLAALQRVGVALAALGDGRADAAGAPALTPSLARALKELRAAGADDQALSRILRNVAGQATEGGPRR